LSPLILHGMDRWLAMHPEMRNNGPLGSTVRSAPLTPCEDLHAHLDKLSLDETRRKIYHATVDKLAASLLSVDDSPSTDITDAFVWVWEVSDDFLPLLEEGTQEAVAIFAYFSVVLKKLDKQWWLQGWADHIISRASQLLDHRHRIWIQWPVEEIGWVAP
jgi:hypothetical protein